MIMMTHANKQTLRIIKMKEIFVCKLKLTRETTGQWSFSNSKSTQCSENNLKILYDHHNMLVHKSVKLAFVYHLFFQLTKFFMLNVTWNHFPVILFGVTPKPTFIVQIELISLITETSNFVFNILCKVSITDSHVTL